MQYSLNHNLGLMEANDNVRRIDLVNNFEAIDNGLSPFYVAEKTETNVYKIITGASKTGLNNGYSVRVAIPSDSNGAVSIVVDTVKIPVKKPNGNAVTNFKANGVYSLTYYNLVFILASGGMDDVTFTSDKLLTGFSANDSNGEKIDGTMPNHGNITQALSLNGNITLPSGYYDSIKVNQSITARGAITAGHSMFKNGDNVYCRIPQGAYFTNATSGFPEISYPQATIANTIGLTPDKIVAGNTIGGVTGTTSPQIQGGTGVYKMVGSTVDGESCPNPSRTFNRNIDVIDCTYYYYTDTGTSRYHRGHISYRFDYEQNCYIMQQSYFRRANDQYQYHRDPAVYYTYRGDNWWGNDNNPKMIMRNTTNNYVSFYIPNSNYAHGGNYTVYFY